MTGLKWIRGQNLSLHPFRVQCMLKAGGVTHILQPRDDEIRDHGVRRKARVIEDFPGQLIGRIELVPASLCEGGDTDRVPVPQQVNSPSQLMFEQQP